MKSIAAAAVLTLVILYCGVSVADEKKAVKITGVYSDMRISQQSGDVIGIEIVLVPSRAGYFVVFQASEGEPDKPLVVPARVSRDGLEFVLPESSSYTGKFIGRFTCSGLEGSFDAGQRSPKGEKVFKLQRQRSIWQ